MKCNPTKKDHGRMSGNSGIKYQRQLIKQEIDSARYPIQCVFTYDNYDIDDEVIEIAINYLKENNLWDDLSEDFGEYRSSDEEHEIDDIIEQLLKDKYTTLNSSTVRFHKNKVGNLISGELSYSDSETDPDEELLGKIENALNAGVFCIRWVTLNETQKEELLSRIEDLIPVFRELQENAQDKDGFFVIHGSSLWGAKSETPNDIDAIFQEFDTETFVVNAVNDMRRPHGSDEVKLSGMGGPLDTLLGIHFDDATLEEDEAYKPEWSEIEEDLRNLLTAGLNEYGSGGTHAKGIRKIINVAFVISHYLPEDLKDGFNEQYGDFLINANLSLVKGSTPEIDGEKADNLLHIWIKKI